LQDAEQATAYGYAVDEPVAHVGGGASVDGTLPHGGWQNEAPETYRLPSSLSIRRCSHFGDTMHFIDRLTRISSDLRSIPAAHRQGYLHAHLDEINRRLRRRMVSKGDISLDVEDNRGAQDWPQITDVAVEHLKYSVHLPLVPQTGKWPSGLEDISTGPPTPEVVRVLNIYVPESRLLSSRERCPFLVHLEVADTGLEGHDARLYASGVSGLGSTVEEVLSMNAHVASTTPDSRRKQESLDLQHMAYSIPPELLEEYRTLSRPDLASSVAMETDVGRREEFPRGGYQADSQYYHDQDDTGYVHMNPYDALRQQQFEQLHLHMQSQQSHYAALAARTHSLLSK
jgi:hypothetical protein